MKLAEFIRSHSEDIAKEWESFARTCAPAAATMNVEQLRDHILPLLLFVADDMDAPQTRYEQNEKAQGRQPLADDEASDAEKHAALRVIDGFSIDQVLGEFRALRASILRLWIEQRTSDTQTDPAPITEPAQIIRFNESIDQMLGESVVRHSELEASAREQSRKRDVFLATLSHELRGPLSAIANGVHLVKGSGATDPQLASVADVMCRQTQHLRRLLDDLLDLARISRNRISLEIAPTDIRVCVQDAIAANQTALTKEAHVLEVDVPETPLMAEIDGTRITQVISNLLSNAVKYSPAGTHIEVSVTRDEEHVMIGVKDDGAGDPWAGTARYLRCLLSFRGNQPCQERLGNRTVAHPQPG